MCLRELLWYFLYLCWDEPDTLYFSPIVRHFPEPLESEATNSYGGLRTFASLRPSVG